MMEDSMGEAAFKSAWLQVCDLYFGEGYVIPNLDVLGDTPLDILVYPAKDERTYTALITCGCSNTDHLLPTIGMEYVMLVPGDWEFVDSKGQCYHHRVWPLLLLQTLAQRSYQRPELFNSLSPMPVLDMTMTADKAYTHFSCYDDATYMPGLPTGMKVDGELISAGDTKIEHLKLRMVSILTEREVTNFNRLFSKILSQVDEMDFGKDVARKSVTQFLYQSAWMKKCWPA